MTVIVVLQKLICVNVANNELKTKQIYAIIIASNFFVVIINEKRIFCNGFKNEIYQSLGAHEK